MKAIRLTMAQALVRFLENQYVRYDDVEQRFVRGVFMLDTAMWWVWVRRFSRKPTIWKFIRARTSRAWPRRPWPLPSR